MIDIDLIEQLMAGNRDRFNLLVWKWEKPIFNFALRYVGDYDLARDITQKTFIRVYKNLKNLKEASRFSSWLYQIATNLCKDEIKKRSSREFLSIDHIYENSENGHLMPKEFIENERGHPDRALNQKQVGEIIQKALNQLPEEQRIVIIMKEYQGLKFREIAEILNEPLNTVKSRMYYGLNGLKKIFEKWNITEEVLNYEV